MSPYAARQFDTREEARPLAKIGFGPSLESRPRLSIVRNSRPEVQPVQRVPEETRDLGPRPLSPDESRLSGNLRESIFQAAIQQDAERVCRVHRTRLHADLNGVDHCAECRAQIVRELFTPTEPRL